MDAKNTKTKTTNVRTWGGSYPACVSETGTVRVYDPVAGHYTTCHSLTAGQVRYVRSRCQPGAVCL